LTVESANVYLRPAKLDGRRDPIPTLAVTLDLPVSWVAQRAQLRDPFVYLVRNVSVEQAEAVEALDLPGVGSEPNHRRIYPRGAVAGQVLGLVGVDSQGLEGVELAYDRDLRGSGESVSMSRDARGRGILTEGSWRPVPRQGARVELTIDAGLQQVAEAELAVAVAAHKAKDGLAIVMQPATGEVLAMAVVPSFDPNQPAAANAEQRRNRAITDSYEPGSTFKGILAAAALENGVVGAEDRIYCENGRYAIGRRSIHDHDPYGWLTFADVIKHSSNIGTGKVGERLGAERWGSAIRAFGFGVPTGIDLPGEVAGIVRPVASWSRLDVFTTSFGQGIAVTPIQLLAAYAALANGGQLMRPYVVRRIIAADGSIVREGSPHVVGQPVSAATAATVTRLLQGVVDGGTGSQAGIDGMAVAGKTGTAQKVDGKTGRYSARDRVSSFIGFVPAAAPRFVILVVIDSPQAVTSGGLVAAPVFRRIAEYYIERLGLRVTSAPAQGPESDPLGPQLASWTLATGESGMPSFVGLSMREALVQAVRAGWEVRTFGSGFVVAQDPPAGVAAAAGEVLTLQFGLDAG